MSDQDFFFDEEEETAKEATKASSKPAAKSSSGKAAPAARTSTTAPAASASPSIFEQSVSMTVAALMAVIGLLVGVIIGFVVAPDGNVAVTPTGAAGEPSTAPQLTDEQLNSGELPEGHPDIGSVPATPTETPAE